MADRRREEDANGRVWELAVNNPSFVAGLAAADFGRSLPSTSHRPQYAPTGLADQFGNRWLFELIEQLLDALHPFLCVSVIVGLPHQPEPQTNNEKNRDSGCTRGE